MLINEYIAHALPIGSRTLIDRYHLDISSATVRNELSHLEEAGYLTSPHTSAGRVPTDFGYRTFVDELLDISPMLLSPISWMNCAKTLPSSTICSIGLRKPWRVSRTVSLWWFRAGS